MNKQVGEKYYIRRGAVYYDNFKGYGVNTGSILKSLQVVKGNFRLNNHDSPYKRVSDETYNNMKKLLVDYYHGEANIVNDFINKLPVGTMYSVDSYTIDVVYPNGLDESYIDYDFHVIELEGTSIRDGYYWSQRQKRDDKRIGRRKLYLTTRGFYFIESGIRQYLNKYCVR